MVQKLFRAIDAIELTDSGSTLDRFSRIASRGIVDNEQVLIKFRELRSEIAHEYLVSDLSEFYNDLFTWSECMVEVVVQVFRYCEQKYPGRVGIPEPLKTR